MVELLCQTSERALKRIENSRRRRDKFLSELKHLPEEQNRRLVLLKQSVKRFEEAVYSGRLANAKNRDQHMTTMKKLCAYLEADPQQLDDLTKLEQEVDKLMEQVMSVHKEHYQFEKKFDADDLLNRVKDMSYQVNVVEGTFFKAQVQPLSAADAVLMLASPTTRQEAEQLAARLKEFVY